MTDLQELIENNRIKLQTIDNVIKQTIDENELEKLHACRRFVKGFIDELKFLEK
jgi:hypothetical protein